jgi:hypothetical protein
LLIQAGSHGLRVSALALCLAASFTACTAVQQYAGYLVTERRSAINPDGVIPQDREIVMLTLKHRGVVFKARCQALDPANHCGELQVGKIYDLERDVHGHFLSSPSKDGVRSWAVLAITEELVE